MFYGRHLPTEVSYMFVAFLLASVGSSAVLKKHECLLNVRTPNPLFKSWYYLLPCKRVKASQGVPIPSRTDRWFCNGQVSRLSWMLLQDLQGAGFAFVWNCNNKLEKCSSSEVNTFSIAGTVGGSCIQVCIQLFYRLWVKWYTTRTFSCTESTTFRLRFPGPRVVDSDFNVTNKS